ncbi:MAG: protein-export rane protein SecF, preprotein translocase subunit SecF [Patescibacteria group bacterium]|nr:protein-export rane protein SecF, preprotein translocase subunit SecF [Patescibacteria group bacterium]
MNITHTNFNIIGNRLRWYVLSSILIIPGIISLFAWGLPLGIDFKGGTLQQVSYENGAPAIENVRQNLEATNIPGVAVQTSGENDLIVRFPNEEGMDPREEGNKILSELQKNNPEVKEVSFQNIGGSVADSTTRKAAWAVALTSLAIIVFIAWSFGSVPKPASSWRFGVTAILALAHDILFVVGAFSLLGHFLPGIEVDALFITAILTILGFSVNDTIVVFDRIRENLRRNSLMDFATVANNSVNQTLARSLNTSMTVLIVLLSLLVIGGPSIRNFVLALFLGVAVGTYSSIFNAAPFLVTWQGIADKRVQLALKKK